MARFKVDDYISLGTSSCPIASSWQVALDAEFTQIIDETLYDKHNVYEWNTPLPKINGDGYYADLDKLYCRVKYHVLNGESDWYILPVGNQNDQEVILKQDGVEIERFNSLEAGFN